MSRLEFPHTTAPASGQCIEVAAGINWIQQSLPFALDHVNCWHLQGEYQSTLIDTGVHTAKSIASMQTYIDLQGKPDSLLLTHYHPDHFGLAGWFAAQGVAVLSNEIEAEVVHRLWGIADEHYEQFYAQWYRQHGVDDAAIEQVFNRGNGYKKLVAEPPKQIGYLKAGETVQLGGNQYQIMLGRGHAPAMIMLHDVQSSVLIAADQVLPTISPNVSLMPNTADNDPLSSFIGTLNELRQLPSDTFVLPSHGMPFYGLHERIDDLLTHHQQRCDQILDACQEPQSARDLFKVLFNRELDAQQLSFALGEALAHTRYLCNLGSLTEINQQAIVQFQTTA